MVGSGSLFSYRGRSRGLARKLANWEVFMRKPLVLIGVLTVAFALVSSASASGANAAAPAVVKVTIFGHPFPAVPGKIVFSPKTVSRGRVVLKITNTDDEWHFFEIAGVRSRFIGPHGGRAIVRLNIKKKGLYFASCPDDHDVNFSGALGVT
jgi:hypothetical protein